MVLIYREDFLVLNQLEYNNLTFQDGVLKEINATKLSLIAENGRHIESVFTKSGKINVGDELESDGHLILIDVSSLNS